MKNINLMVVLCFVFQLFFIGCTDNGNTNHDMPPVPVPTSDASTSPIPTHNWPVPSFKSSIDLNASDLGRIGENTITVLKSGKNSFFDVDNSEVQLNELVPSDPEDLASLFGGLFALTGSVNTIVMGHDRVYEIISVNPYAAEAVRYSLDVPEIQKLKLTPSQAYGEFAVTSDVVPWETDLDAVSNSLDFQIDFLINQTISLDGMAYMVNFIKPSDTIDPLVARDKLVDFKESDLGVYAINDVIVEVVTDDLNIADKVWRTITIPPPSASDEYIFRVKFSAIPLKKADPMKLNKLFNMLTSGNNIADLQIYDPTLEFGDTFPLFLCEGRTVLESEPAITLDKIDFSISAGSVVVPESEIGEPVEVDIDLQIHTNRAYERGPEDIVKYVEATDFWPVSSYQAKEILDEVRSSAGSDSTMDTIYAINNWINDNIEYGGNVEGSRYGFDNVIRQGYGHCWDMADVFATVSRTAGLPTREVVGQLYGVGGHVWVQVWLEEQGAWIDVDPTENHVGVNGFYIPVWGTIDGELYFLYSTIPTIERIG